MTVAFINENILGHNSYLPRFIEELDRRPELGIQTRCINVLPLPPEDDSRHWHIRGLYRLGLDFGIHRWRQALSRHAARQLEALMEQERVDAVVVNTQSVGLHLPAVIGRTPLLVGMDATFSMLAATPWFAQTRAARWFHPLTLGALMRQERVLLRRADCLLPWSGCVAGSLRTDYGIDEHRITWLPPSLRFPEVRSRAEAVRPQLLFIGGDFVRKGGVVLKQAWERRLKDRCDLNVVTQTQISEVSRSAGFRVHSGVVASTERWRELWEGASVFVFPSQLETFGIVLIEALAFGVPVVSSRAGVAEEILAKGAHGVLLPEVSAEAIERGVLEVLDAPEVARQRTLEGQAWCVRNFDLETNTKRLADVLHRVGANPSPLVTEG